MKCCGFHPVTPIKLVVHAPGAPGLRFIGLGPGLRPSRGLVKLQRLFDRHAFWARGRSFTQLRRLLAGSDAVMSVARQTSRRFSAEQLQMASAEQCSGTSPLETYKGMD